MAEPGPSPQPLVDCALHQSCYLFYVILLFKIKKLGKNNLLDAYK
jgi:hypothetical protein